MKSKFYYPFSTLAMIALALFFVVGCEGPMGPEGADGTDGIDGNLTCLECHSEGNIQTVKEQFYQSVHSAGEVAVDYAGGRASCAQCHSNEGFVEFASNGEVLENIAAPTPWECSTCHGLHETFEEIDYALRLDDPIAFIFDASVTADFGNGNLCANCHQSRAAEPNVSNPGSDFEITSSHYGPHHGAQSNVLYGAGFAEIVGSQTYPAAGVSTHFTGASCTSCHMGEYTNVPDVGWGSGDPALGGHTFNPNVEACVVCHTSATDFDYASIQTTVQAQLDELKALLLAQGVIEEGFDEFYEVDPDTGEVILVVESDGFHPHTGTYTMAQAQAFFNWTGLNEDRSVGVHNPDYVKALLTNSIEAITNN
ncbi:MAG: hypothetical protein GY816_10460 [Cytophagales bacterium]|nr:hypothetical protein [Cytophagales bacterium]